MVISLPFIFVLDRRGGGSDVFVWVFLKGYALIHSRKEGHDFFRKKILKYPGPPSPRPPIKNVLSLRNRDFFFFRKTVKTR